MKAHGGWGGIGSKIPSLLGLDDDGIHAEPASAGVAPESIRPGREVPGIETQSRI